MTPPPAPSNRGDQRGAALITVLLLVAVMSVAATAMLDDVRFATRRAANVADREQAVWYALGAETLARQTLHRSWLADAARSTLNEPWAANDLFFPTDGGGIRGGVRDGGACLNLNGLSEEVEGGGYVPAPGGAALFVALLQELDFTEADARALADTVSDWIDADDTPSGRGAEDFDYIVRDPPHRAGNTRFIDVDELRAVGGVTQELYVRLRPLVCALPDDDALRLNVNTLQERHAPLIAAALENLLPAQEAAFLIADRPQEGFPSLDAFFELDALTQIAVTPEMRARFTEKTTYFDLDARINHFSAFIEVSATLEQLENGELRLVRRRFGALQ